jgi:tetratricopeptide (TPR) repeat protein
VDIRPGSVKEARTEAGLSLGQVARQDISRTAIYFVETGKAKPSMETLALIAERTGRPIEFFLGTEGEVAPAARIAELERLLAVGDNAGAAAAGDELLSRRLDPESQARIRLIAALAHLRLGQPVPGRRLASAARAYFEQAGDAVMTAESLGTEAQALYVLEDPAALTLAEEALVTLRSVEPVPQAIEARLLMILAGVRFLRREWQTAIDLYEQAIGKGEVVQDLHQLSLMYSGLSAAYHEIGHFGEATRYAQKALTIHEMLRDRLSLARSLNNLGYTLLHLGEFQAARTHIERSLRIFAEEGVEVGKGHALTSLAELEYRLGRIDESEAQAREALAVSSRLGEAALVGEAHVWMARCAARRGRPEVADAEFEAALAAVGPLGSGPRLSEVHEAYAEVLEARGDLAGANEHLKRALAAAHTAPAAIESRIAIA